MKTFVLLGVTGAGKSSFVNSVFGSYIAETHEFEACTKIVTHFARGTPYGNLKIIDTPGFGEEGVALDLRYMDEVVRSIGNDDCTLAYVTRLNENRLRTCEKRAIQVICGKLISKLWSDPWLVFTFAGMVAKSQLPEAFSIRRKQIEHFIASQIGENEFSFKRSLMIDNVVVNWHGDAKLAAEVLLS